jgi:hypothetical protein
MISFEPPYLLLIEMMGACERVEVHVVEASPSSRIECKPLWNYPVYMLRVARFHASVQLGD